MMLFETKSRETVLEKLSLVISLGRASNLEALAEAEIQRITDFSTSLKRTNKRLSEKNDSFKNLIEDVTKEKNNLSRILKDVENDLEHFLISNKLTPDVKETIKNIILKFNN